jgi:hypothetical protein
MNYKEIKFTLGDNVESAVFKLLEYKNTDIVAYGVFNGVVLFSDTVTLDNAHEEILNMSHREFKIYELDLIEQAFKDRENKMK